MKSFLAKALLAVLLAGTPLFTAAQDSKTSDARAVAVQPTTTIVVQTEEAKALAKSFVQAFDSLNHQHTIVLAVRRDGKLWTISGLRTLTAVGSVLVVETEKGRTVVPAKDVELITDMATVPME